jgi:hypothetical protein
VEQARLQGAKRTVGGQRPLLVGSGIDDVLPINVVDHGVVGIDEAVNCRRRLGCIGRHRNLHCGGGIGADQAQSYATDGPSYGVGGTAVGHTVDGQRCIGPADRWIEVQSGRVIGDR